MTDDWNLGLSSFPASLRKRWRPSGQMKGRRRRRNETPTSEESQSEMQNVLEAEAQREARTAAGVIDGGGVITQDYCRCAANYTSCFVSSQRGGGGEKIKQSSILLNKRLNGNISGLMLIWRGTPDTFSLWRPGSVWFCLVCLVRM